MAKDNQVVEKIKEIAQGVFTKIRKIESPELTMPIRSLTNVAYNEKEGYFKILDRLKTRTLTASTIKTFAQTLKMMNLSKELVKTQDIATKREAYYVSKNWGEARFKEQPESDSVMDDIEAMMRVNREQIGFIPEEKGGEGPYIPFRWKVLSQLSEGTVLGISDDPSNKTSQSNSIPQEIMLREIDNMEMVFVEQGSFTMGTEDGAYRSPLHEVYLESYWIDKYEVTNEQFSAFLNIHGNQKVDGKDWFDIKWQNRSKVTVSGKSGKPTYSPIDGYENHPVVSVSWHGARAYCQWIGGDLPTEEQWEKAARGTDGRTFPWGEHDPSCGEAFHGHCVSEPPDADTKAVGGQHPVIVSPYGAHDMAGNVAEWVLGWDYDDFIMNSEDNVSYTPLNGYIPIARGGSWRDTSKTFFQVFYRYPGGGAEPFIGFRCAIPASN